MHDHLWHCILCVTDGVDAPLSILAPVNNSRIDKYALESLEINGRLRFSGCVRANTGMTPVMGRIRLWLPVRSVGGGL